MRKEREREGERKELRSLLVLQRAMSRRETFLSFAAGSLSGLCTTVLFQPFDLVKTRMQSLHIRVPVPDGYSFGTAARSPWGGGPGPVCLANANGSSGTISMLNIVESVIRKENIAGLWKGISPSIQRCVPSIGCYFGAITYLRRALRRPESNKLTMFQSLGIGAFARMFATGSFLPFIVVKTRYESGQFGYRSVSHAFTSIWKTEGGKGLFSGMGATLARDAPFSALYLMFYTQSRQLIADAKGLRPDDELSLLYTMPCGLASGTLASIITQPFDVVKTRMQLQPQEYSSFRHTFRSIVGNNGVTGLFTGFAPRLMRKTLMAAFTWAFYEQIHGYISWTFMNR